MVAINLGTKKRCAEAARPRLNIEHGETKN